MCREPSNKEPAKHREEETPGYNLLLPHLPPAAVANFQDKTDAWTQCRQSLERWHFVPSLVTFMP
eukprot:1151316-Pyramimonas_sp.AAC.1